MPKPPPNGHTIEAEIFSTGVWNGETFTEHDLEEIARNFQKLRHQLRPPLKFGHDESQTLLLLGPHIPLLFMGEEWGETASFGFFTDFGGELADAVREGRRREFRRFARFADEANRARIPDPNAESTFLASRIDWTRLDRPEGQERHALFRKLLETRRREIVPYLKGTGGYAGTAKTVDDRALGVQWRLGDGAMLSLIANLDDDPCPAPLARRGRVLFETETGIADALAGGPLPGWSVVVLLDDDGAGDAGG